MSIATALTALANDVDAAKAAITAKGGTAPNGTADMAGAIAAIPSGGVEDITWNQCPQLVKDYLDEVTYDPTDYTTSQIANYAPNPAVASNTKPIGKTVDGVTYYNEVPNVATPFASTNKAGTIKPLDRLRWINTPHAHNVRDLGGWQCDGGTVRYGMLYRSGEIYANDKNVLLNDCGIRWELNLRGQEVSRTEESVLGNIGYSHPWYSTPFMWYKACTYAEHRTAVKECLEAVFNAVGNDIPLIYHCAEGADRTGTLSCLLEGILGVSQSDIDKDYELTCFQTGTDTDSHARRRNEAEWSGLISYINAFSGDSFRNKLVFWMVETLGISVKSINRFRANAINGTPEKFYSITNTLSHCSTNNAHKVILGGEYNATITPESGYVFGGTLEIKMGGVDITSSAFDNGAITIANVTGDIDINITAIEYVPSYTNVFDYTTAEANYRFKSDNTLYASNGYFVTDFIACDCSSAAKVLRVKNATWASNAKILWCDSSKSILGGYMKASINVIDEGNGVYRTKVGWYESTQGDASTDHESANRPKIRYIRLALQKSSSAITQSDLADVIMTLDEVIE